MNILSLFPLIPLVMMLGLWISKNTRQIHAVMVAGSSALLALAIYLVFHYLGLREAGATDAMLLTDSVVWYAPLNIHYAVGVDGISVAMLLLSAIIVFTGTFASWQMKSDVKAYFLWFCLLSVGVFGFFITVDLFSMFMFYEVALIPMYLLIGVWGSGRKEYSAMKLTLMLMGGSALLLCGILGIYFGAGAQTMNLHEIAALHNIPLSQQYIWFPMVFVGFGVLGALFPFHTWSPDGHASAPTAVSMLHAGVLMKLGGYGCFRVAMYLMPEAAHELSWIFIILTTISVVYGAFSACVQTDLKYINAYSSVSHCGLVLFAILMMNTTAGTGAILQMLSHGLMTALFFALNGDIHSDAAHAKQGAGAIQQGKADIQQHITAVVNPHDFFALVRLPAAHHLGVDLGQAGHGGGVLHPVRQGGAGHGLWARPHHGGVAVADLQIAALGVFHENHRRAIGQQRGKLAARQIQRNQAGAMRFDQGGNRQASQLRQPQDAGDIGEHDGGGERPVRMRHHRPHRQHAGRHRGGYFAQW